MVDGLLLSAVMSSFPRIGFHQAGVEAILSTRPTKAKEGQVGILAAAAPTLRMEMAQASGTKEDKAGIGIESSTEVVEMGKAEIMVVTEMGTEREAVMVVAMA